MGKQIDVILGSRTFAVAQLPIRADAAWRAKVKEIVEPISELAMASGVSAPTPERLVRLAFTSALIIDPGAVLDAVLDYSPTLAAEAEWIGDHAFSDEALQALLALFFGMTAAANGSVPTLPATT